MTPVCLYCDEAILEGEPFDTVNGGADTLHAECLLRMVIGSVGHQRERCPCFGGVEGDPVGLSRREAARAAAMVFHALNPPATLQ